MCWGQTSAKVIYQHNLNMTALQLLSLRAMAAFALNCLHLNLSLPKVVSVPRQQQKGLVVRVVLGSVSLLVNYTALKYFDLMTVAVFNNLSPLVVCMLGCLFCGESMTRGQLVMILTAFASILLIIFGTKE
jgi:drug/metabolite transporter (DMT)-like permease